MADFLEWVASTGKVTWLGGCAARAAPTSSRLSDESLTPRHGPSERSEPALAALRPVARPQAGVASWYGRQHRGQRTANGEIHDSRQRTAAHRTLPFGSLVMVTDTRTGRAVQVRINDRGPYVDGRIIDLSVSAARELGILNDGTAPVTVQLVSLGG